MLFSFSGCLALPKLNLQFLTLHDYLLRNFNLFRLESTYEIRQDIEDSVSRMKPWLVNWFYLQQRDADNGWHTSARNLTHLSSSSSVSVQFSHSVIFNSLQHYGLQHTRLPYHQLPELTQTHVHPFGDAVQPSHPLSSPSHPDFNLSQHQGPFQWVSSPHQAAKVLEFQL